MTDRNDPEFETGKRLDAFVDAAFAFAVTLLIIASAEQTASLQDLWRALGRIPASLGAFTLLVMFWMAYREFGRRAPRRDTLSTLNALAIVFVVLVYVFPLRMLIESGFVWISGGRLSGAEVIHTLGDLRDLFRIYGVGFAVLAGLFATLFLQALRRPEPLGVAPADLASVRSSLEIWLIAAAAGVSSVLLTFGPMTKAPWLPGMAYWLIPIVIGLRAAFQGRRVAKKSAAQPSASG